MYVTFGASPKNVSESNILGALKLRLLFFGRRFFCTRLMFFNVLTHVKCDFRCRGAKSLILQWFYKQNEIACILWFGVLGGLEGVLRQGCFVSCFKTTARINILRGNITFCVLVPAGSNPYFLSQRDFEGAQDMFFEKCEILSKTHGNSSK